MKRKFKVEIFEDVDGKTKFKLLQDEQFTKEGIIVPAGFVTDFASVPRLLWSLFAPIGKVNSASLVHDYLYDTRKINGRKRKDVDKLFLQMMLDSGVKKVQACMMYWGVRLGGRRWWLN